MTTTSTQPAQNQIPQHFIDAAKDAFARDRPLTEDLRPGSFFDNPAYLDTLSHNAKSLICAVQDAGDHPDRPGLCHIQSELALNMYLQSNDEAQLNMAFALAAISLRYIRAELPGRGKSNHHMGVLYQRKWERERNNSDLDEAVRHYKLAVEVCKEPAGVRGEWACDVAVVCLQRYMRTKQPEDKADACSHFDRAIELAGQSPTRARHLSNKGESLFRIASINEQEKGSLLNESIASHNEAIAFCDAHPGLSCKPHAPYGMIHRNAARAHLERFSLEKQTEDSEKACSLFEKALTFETIGSSDYELFVCELGNARKLVAEASGDADPDEKACELWRESIEANPSAIAVRISLAEAYRQKAGKSLDQSLAQDLLQQAATLVEDAVKAMPSGYPAPGAVFSRCAAVHYSLYEANGDLSGIDRAIECARKATTDQGNENLWDYHRLLGQFLVSRFENTQRAQDLVDCISTATESLSKCPQGDSKSQGHCLWVIGKATRASYDTFRNTELLRKASMVFLHASQLLREDPSTISLVMNDLGNAYTQLFTHDALPELLEKAIDAYKEALSGLQQFYGTDQHPDIFMVNTSLGYVMMQRFFHWRSDTDLESAIKYYRRSLSHIDEHHPRYAIRAGNLSNALQLRSDIEASVEDLKEARKMLITALEGPVSLSDELKTGLATQVGNAYLRSHSITNQLADVENAVSYYDKAVEAAGTASASTRGAAVGNKAVALKELAEYTGQLSDFQASLKTFDETLQMLSKEDRHHWGAMMNQANLLFSLYERKMGPETKDYGYQALEKFEHLAQMQTLPPGTRINVASVAASLTNDLVSNPAKARDYILTSLDLLPEAILMHVTRLEQLSLIRKYQYVPGSAAALSLIAGDPPSTVIRRLEAGRAFIWDRIDGRPTQLEALESENPELAGKFRTLQQRVSQQARSPGTMDNFDSTSVAASDSNRMQRQHDTDAYRQVLEQIRALPHFDSFLTTPDTAADLQAYAANAPIVFINATNYRSDALVITNYDVLHLPLPSFSMAQVTEYGALFMHTLQIFGNEEDQAAALAQYQTVMKWLWEAAAKPIMEAIDWDKYERGPSGKPRIIWVSAGWISVLPIHAAGDFQTPGESNEPRCVHDIAVSSYTNSLKALEFTIQSASRMKTQPLTRSQQVLIVAMATTPGLGPDGDLNVEPEINAIEKILSPSFSIKVLNEPDSRAVKANLAPSRIAHFACHAKADVQDPSRSSIMLQDNQTKPSPFSVRTLLRLDLINCELVYLSACESGASKDLRLRDEGIHIAGGFHIAGVPHVISTLWKVSDSVSAELAGLFYANLRKGEHDDGDLSSAPYALDDAIGEMRRRGVHPMLWGPFIHSGP
ncbi:hypothetical protein FE257_002122 [Aspergillus nanangensis]|uniref:CHAT domain-containing protein n=1 Tax=Aspergillus nanangensis TaxID=2582783 RepID=A0AAD4GX57_ASPNN|nr:hypothetical protein FE257_002122 [Aspergillus nanangensis]